MDYIYSFFRRINDFGRRHPIAMLGFMLIGVASIMSFVALFSMLNSGASFYASLPTKDVVIAAMAASAVYVTNLSIPLAMISTTVVDIVMWCWRTFTGRGKANTPPVEPTVQPKANPNAPLQSAHSPLQALRAVQRQRLEGMPNKRLTSSDTLPLPSPVDLPIRSASTGPKSQSPKKRRAALRRVASSTAILMPPFNALAATTTPSSTPAATDATTLDTVLESPRNNAR